MVGVGSGEGTGAVFVTLHFNIIQSHQAEGICYELFLLIKECFFFLPRVEMFRLNGQQANSA